MINRFLSFAFLLTGIFISCNATGRNISSINSADTVIDGIAEYVDAYYSSESVLTDSSGAVLFLKALKGKDLPYVGLPRPTIRKPYLAEKEVVFTNQPNANYKLLTRENSNPFTLPEEQTIVFRKMPGTDWEAIISGWGNYYLGFGGINDIRAMRSDAYVKHKVPLKYFELVFLHVRFENTGNGTGRAQIWLNGEYYGDIISQGQDWSRRLGYGVGIETNSTDFNWKATMFIERGMSTAERDAYFKAIKKEYKIGSMPYLPYASNINIIEKGGKLFASYKYNGKNPENKSKVEYQWWKLAPDLGSQLLISTSPAIANQSGVKVCVKVTDIKGNSWMFVSGTYN
ncbi:hypothetical protein [Niabella ginsengisoli]|uniref:DUF2931 family protein n=1 Tax=Niabella ginsengisoli TaxID=522298 RepID=A0ABS9SIQ8_9BACT|nr:hypothetical protein [Niabella ginsengisoli]MCH5598229.1 hypothetical protein [Niabella ginsengisoli]